MGSIEEVENDEDRLVNEIDSFLIEDDDIWVVEAEIINQFKILIQNLNYQNVDGQVSMEAALA